jgi:hypothetical protein
MQTATMSGNSPPCADHTARSTLVVPGGTSEALAYRREALGRGLRLIGASSVRNDPARDLYVEWVELPPVFAAAFEDRFRDVVERRNVGAIFCPHSILHDRIRDVLRARDLPAELINPHPAEEQERRVEGRLDESRGLRPYMTSVAARDDVLADLEIAALLQATGVIPGQSDTTKLATIMAMFPMLPKGDIVEVGVYWGRSAYLLAWLARRYRTGSVLAVDPWAAEHAVQNDAPALVRDDTFRQDWDAIHRGFLMHLLPVAIGQLSYLRAPSRDAARQYADLDAIDSPPFGPVSFSRRISLLHIDGNHDHEAARADIEAWLPHVAPRGMIMLDDYVWIHGDGPRRAADALLAQLGERATRSFVAGGALFIQLSPAAAGR